MSKSVETAKSPTDDADSTDYLFGICAICAIYCVNDGCHRVSRRGSRCRGSLGRDTEACKSPLQLVYKLAAALCLACTHIWFLIVLALDQQPLANRQDLMRHRTNRFLGSAPWCKPLVEGLHHAVLDPYGCVCCLYQTRSQPVGAAPNRSRLALARTFVGARTQPRPTRQMCPIAEAANSDTNLGYQLLRNPLTNPRYAVPDRLCFDLAQRLTHCRCGGLLAVFGTSRCGGLLAVLGTWRWRLLRTRRLEQLANRLVKGLESWSKRCGCGVQLSHQVPAGERRRPRSSFGLVAPKRIRPCDQPSGLNLQQFHPALCPQRMGVCG